MNKLKSTRIYGDLYIDGLAKVNSNDIITTTNLSSTIQTVSPNSLTTTGNRSYSIQRNASGQLVVNIPWTDTTTNWYPTSFSWTNGTTNGPVGSLTGTGMPSVSIGAIPAASNTVSGIVTTGVQTFKGNKTFDGDTVITGDLTVSGTNFIAETTTVRTDDDLIELRSNGTTSITTPAGIAIKKYDGTNDGGIVIKNDGEVRVGKITIGTDGKISGSASNAQPVLTRAEKSSLTNNDLLVWESTNNRAVTKTLSDLGIANDDDVVKLSGDQTIKGITTLEYPTAFVSGEQPVLIAKVPTSATKSGSISIVKEGTNSGIGLKFEQEVGTTRLMFRGSATPGAMVWAQPEEGSRLYLDVSSIDFRGSGFLLESNDFSPKTNNTKTIGTDTKRFNAIHAKDIYASGNKVATENWVTSNTRSSSWMPTAAQVGARPDNWNPQIKTINGTTLLGTGDIVIPKGDTGPKGDDGADGSDGAPGQSATISGATATVNNAVGTPGVTVTSGGTSSNRSFAFAFTNLKGAPGTNGTNATITGATATVNNAVGTPGVTVTPGGSASARTFAFEFTNLKGDKGDPGADGLTTSVQLGDITKNHTNGTITFTSNELKTAAGLSQVENKNYLPTTGGTITGSLTINENLNVTKKVIVSESVESPTYKTGQAEMKYDTVSKSIKFIFN